MAVRFTGAHGWLVVQVSNDATEWLPIWITQFMLDNPLQGGGEADEVNKTLHVEALHMELAEHSLLAVDVADRACVMCKLLLPLLP